MVCSSINICAVPHMRYDAVEAEMREIGFRRAYAPTQDQVAANRDGSEKSHPSNPFVGHRKKRNLAVLQATAKGLRSFGRMSSAVNGQNPSACVASSGDLQSSR